MVFEFCVGKNNGGDGRRGGVVSGKRKNGCCFKMFLLPLTLMLGMAVYLGGINLILTASSVEVKGILFEILLACSNLDWIRDWIREMRGGRQKYNQS